MDFSDNPYELLQVMRDARAAAASFRSSQRWRRFWLLILFPLGIPFPAIDWLLGFNFFTFTLVTVALWSAGILGLLFLGRRQATPSFGPRYTIAETIFDVLKDDLPRQRPMSGWLDLTGGHQESKVIRKKKAPSGRPVVYYKDEWLRLKMRLVDGNVLRLSLIDRIKERQGYWKVSRISGKRKFKPGSEAVEHQVLFSVTVNDQAYGLQDFGRLSQIPGAGLAVMEASARDGRIVLRGGSNQLYDAWDVLKALQFGYERLTPLA